MSPFDRMSCQCELHWPISVATDDSLAPDGLDVVVDSACGYKHAFLDVRRGSPQDVLDSLVAFFGKPLDEVPGLSVDFGCESQDEAVSLSLRRGVVSCRRSVKAGESVTLIDLGLDVGHGRGMCLSDAAAEAEDDVLAEDEPRYYWDGLTIGSLAGVTSGKQLVSVIIPDGREAFRGHIKDCPLEFCSLSIEHLYAQFDLLNVFLSAD